MINTKLLQKILSIPAESRTLEFKRLGSRNDGIDKTLESIVAMCNTDGGVLIIGVDDPEQTKLKGFDRIFGIEENINLYEDLGREVDKISPPISGTWPPRLITIPEKKQHIALLIIPKVTDCLRSINNQVYVRGEKGNKRLSPQDMIHYSYVKGFEKADKELEDVDFKLLNTLIYEEWRTKRGLPKDKIENNLEKTGLARRNDSGKLLPTRAAVLLFAEYPNDLMTCKCSIRIFQYQGTLETIKETLNLLSIPININGPVIEQIKKAHEIVLNILKTGLKIPSGFLTTYRVPERAVKEAITNAVIHRDYHTKKDITVRIFEDRIEIQSPGLLPFNITPSNIGIVRAYGYRNDLLVKHLRELPSPPNLDENEGVRAMRKVMKDNNLYPPIFFTYPFLQDAVRIILLNTTAPSEWDKISDYLNKNKYISNTEARNVLNIQDTVKVSKLFNRWCKKGLLYKVIPHSGSKRTIKYRLPNTDERTLITSTDGK